MFSLYDTHSKLISIHVPAWGTTGCCLNISLSVPNFNPRSRVGNDDDAICGVTMFDISIHVPAWGTTAYLQGEGQMRQISIHIPAWGTTVTKLWSDRESYISIHVPAWGTTVNDELVWSSDTDFNPRSRVGNDSATIAYSPSSITFQSTFPRGERRGVTR